MALSSYVTSIFLNQHQYLVNGSYSVENKIRLPVQGQYPVKLAHEFIGDSHYTTLKTSSFIGQYDLESKLQFPCVSLYPIKVAQELESISHFYVKTSAKLNSEYPIENRLQMPLTGVYSVRLSGALVGIHGFMQRLTAPYTAIYDILKREAYQLHVQYGIKAAYAQTITSTYLETCKFTLTGVNTFVHPVVMPYNINYDLLPFNPVQKKLTSVYNISAIITHGLTTITVLKN